MSVGAEKEPPDAAAHEDLRPSEPGRGEFVAIAALMFSLVALSIDAMLPVLPEIGAALAIPAPNDAQYIISALFIGLAVGQIIYGPLSDVYGRKPLIYIGLGVFACGSLLSALSTDFDTMLIGRVLQGLGAAGPRIVMVAMVRDRFEGRAMAQVMSFVMAVFIFMPALAPAIGQGIMLAAGWRMIFWFFILLGLINTVWFLTRIPESLPRASRAPLSPLRIYRGFKEALSNRITLGYTLATGFIFSPFVAYLSMSQQVFQQDYGLGRWFPLHFAILSLAIGAASILNGKLVIRFGMRRISRLALILSASTMLTFLAVCAAFGREPDLLSVSLVLMVSFFCVGMLFGNLNALAMEPMGHIAGVASALVGSLASIIAVPFGALISQSYTGSVLPMIGGFGAFCLLSLAMSLWADKEHPPGPIVGSEADLPPTGER